jgi:hypothetical protein
VTFQSTPLPSPPPYPQGAACRLLEWALAIQEAALGSEHLDVLAGTCLKPTPMGSVCHSC